MSQLAKTIAPDAMHGSNPAAGLADFVETFDLGKVPLEVIARAKLNILDAFGIGLASTTYDYAKAITGALAEIGGEGSFPVIGMSLRLGQRDSAHVNGTLIHGLDFDDTHSGSVVHTSASAAPTMLAAGLATGASGARALGCFIIASEVSSRIGLAAAGAFHEKGFHPTGVVGAFGAALAAGYLYDLSIEQLMHAQGIVLSKAAGSLEFLEDGAWTKRQHPGWSSVCGQSAAIMAKHGFIGPSRPYDGRYGLYQMYTNDGREIDLPRITDELGKRWDMMQIAFKPYPACHLTHACADAILALKRQHNLSAADIKSVTARLADGVIPVVCEPEANKKLPRNSYDAQFSVHYVMAAAFVRNRFTLEELEDAAIGDPEILDLCARTSYAADPHSAYPTHYSGAVEIETNDGRVLSHREQINRGAADNPLPDAAIEAKFFDNARRAVPQAQAESVHAIIMELDSHAKLDALAAALQKP